MERDPNVCALMLAVGLVSCVCVAGVVVGLTSSIWWLVTATQQRPSDEALVIATAIMSFILPPGALISGSILLYRMLR